MRKRGNREARAIIVEYPFNTVRNTVVIILLWLRSSLIDINDVVVISRAWEVFPFIEIFLQCKRGCYIVNYVARTYSIYGNTVAIRVTRCEHNNWCSFRRTIAPCSLRNFIRLCAINVDDTFQRFVKCKYELSFM